MRAWIGALGAAGLVVTLGTTGCGHTPSAVVHNLKAPSRIASIDGQVDKKGVWRQAKRGGFTMGQTEHTYPVMITSPAVLRIVLSDISPGQDYDLFLLTEDGRELYLSRCLGNRAEFIETGFLQPGTYEVQVLNYKGQSSTRAYKLNVEVYGQRGATSPATANTSIQLAGPQRGT